MTEPFDEASVADLAEQAAPANAADSGSDWPVDYRTQNADADIADLIEQQQEVPVGDDDYDRG